MSDRSSAAQRAARAAAVAVSLGLFAFVIINAQFGCDAPATNAPPQERSSEREPDAKGQPSAEPQPSAAAPTTSVAEPKPAEPKPEANAKPEAGPVFMPASKSGGDFGTMRFPGEKQAEPTQQAPQQQAPQQQAQGPAPKQR